MISTHKLGLPKPEPLLNKQDYNRSLRICDRQLTVTPEYKNSLPDMQNSGA